MERKLFYHNNYISAEVSLNSMTLSIGQTLMLLLLFDSQIHSLSLLYPVGTLYRSSVVELVPNNF